jgi:hypothetical protein
MADPLGPTPLVATHVLKMTYTIGGLLHGISPFVKAQVGTGATGYDLVSFYGGGIDTQDVIDVFAIALQKIMVTGTAAAGWFLYLIDGGALVLLATGSWSLTPGGGAVSYAGKQWTVVGRDEDLFFHKMVLPEIAAGDFQHYGSIASIPAGDIHDFCADFIDTAPENWGGFFRNRNDKAAKTFTGLTCGPNRKFRRQRNLV